jgi:PhoD-like phosphatase
MTALQEIATENNGTRAAATPGYDASLNYVRQRLEAAGYDTFLDPFPFARSRRTTCSRTRVATRDANGVSPTGRTKTLADDYERVRFAICSCAKFNAGFFNAYAAIPEHEELDFLLHLGDYIYEASNTPPKSQTPGADIGRPFDPLGECRTLADYRGATPNTVATRTSNGST